MPDICDNKSVGVIIKSGDRYAVIKRRNYPVAYTFVAGHLDGDTPEEAARKEAREEAGQAVLGSLEQKIGGLKLANPCRRENGAWHEWYIFEANVPNTKLSAGSDAKEAFWTDRERLEKLIGRTHEFSKKLGLPIDDLTHFIPAVTSDPEWQKEPGFEPVWIVLLNTIGWTP